MLSCLDNLDPCGLFLTEEFPRSGCRSVKKEKEKKIVYHLGVRSFQRLTKNKLK